MIASSYMLRWEDFQDTRLEVYKLSHGALQFTPT